MYVALHFVRFNLISRPEEPVNESTWELKAANYTFWTSSVINYLTPTYDNILMWGLAWQFEPVKWPIGGTPEQIDAARNNPWSKLWKRVYQSMDATARARSPRPGVLGLIGTEIASFGANITKCPMVSRSWCQERRHGTGNPMLRSRRSR